MALTHRDVTLLWAHAELHSPRWRYIYSSKIGEALCRKAETVPASSLNANEQDRLIAALASYRRHFIEKYVDTASNFEWQEMSPEALMLCYVMPDMGYDPPVTLDRYIADDFDPTNIEDPRMSAWSILRQPVPAPLFGHPILIRDQDKTTLVEGYTRATVMLKRWQSGQRIGAIKVVVGS